MARSETLRTLLRAWASGDDAAFLGAAQGLVEEERRKGHALLADGLEASLRDPRRPGGPGALALRPVPKGRDDRPLLTLGKPRRDLDDLVLPKAVQELIEGFLHEHHHRGLLSAHALKPRQKILLVGPPGSGKTATAHAIAADLSLPVAVASLPALTSSFLGETARNVEAVIRFAESSPCLLLLDEFDALATERSTPGDHGELRRVVATVLQLLEEVRGESIVAATSNHAAMLDSAVWRRFDEVVTFAHPDSRAVQQLLKLKTRGVDQNFDARKWSTKFKGASAADIETVCNDAVRLAVLDGTERLADGHLAAAFTRLSHRQDLLQHGKETDT
ncbi:MAG: ATPase [Acidimicrobiaceae bacterium]|nr:ATPase [Acidimicrobiaceae bacterium]